MSRVHPSASCIYQRDLLRDACTYRCRPECLLQASITARVIIACSLVRSLFIVFVNVCCHVLRSNLCWGWYSCRTTASLTPSLLHYITKRRNLFLGLRCSILKIHKTSSHLQSRTQQLLKP